MINKIGAWVLKMVTNLVISILLLVLKILRAPVAIIEELTDEQGPLFAKSQRKVTREDFESPIDFLGFLRAKVVEVWGTRISTFIAFLWRQVLWLFRSPVDSLSDFYDNIDDPNYDPSDKKFMAQHFKAKAQQIWELRRLKKLPPEPGATAQIAQNSPPEPIEEGEEGPSQEVIPEHLSHP